MALADAAERFGAGSLRVTPWRALVVPGVGRARGRALLDAGTRLGLITDPADPRLAVAACPGHPACASATMDTRADAAALAALGLPGPSTSLAAPRDAPIPGRPRSPWSGTAGRYGIVRHGRAADPPESGG